MSGARVSNDKEPYDVDEVDGLRRDVVGAWTSEKHIRLQHYVDITRDTRKKYTHTGYVDLYCATGRARLRDTTDVVDGSPLVAVKEAAAKGVPFRHIHIADVDTVNLAACAQRLRNAGISGVQEHSGPAVETAEVVVRALDPYGLYIAFLDPYNLATLPFDVVRTLGRLKRMDLIVHISEQDLQRSAIGKQQVDVLEAFAPGCSSKIDFTRPMLENKIIVLDQWKALLLEMGYKVHDNLPRVRGSNNQPLYWLAYASRSELGDRFWGQVSDGPQRGFKF